MQFSPSPVNDSGTSTKYADALGEKEGKFLKYLSLDQASEYLSGSILLTWPSCILLCDIDIDIGKSIAYDGGSGVGGAGGGSGKS